MRKHITVFCALILSMMISFFLPVRINAAEYPAEYKEFLEELRYVVERTTLRYPNYLKNQQRSNVVEQLQLSAAARSFFLSSDFDSSSPDLFALHYAIRDLDNNGIPELLLSYNKDALCAVFTVQNGTPVMIRGFMYRDMGAVYGKYLYNYGGAGVYHYYHYCVLKDSEFTPIDGYNENMGELYDINDNSISRSKTTEIDTKYKNLSTPEWHMLIPGTFADVDYSGWYSEPVVWAAEKGITSGTSEIGFSPNENCNRAQMVTFLWRAKGCPEPTLTICPFDDVQPNTYYYKAVLWALENRITSGTSGTLFSPNAIVTRAQTATFLWRLSNMPIIECTNPFSDVEKSSYYYDAVLWAVSENVTKGTSSTSFSPNAACTRAQIVTFLYRTLCPDRFCIEVSNYFKAAERLQSALTMEKTEPWNLGGASFVKDSFYVETSKGMFSMKNEGNHDITLYGAKLGNNISAFYDCLIQNNWLPMDQAQNNWSDFGTVIDGRAYYLQLTESSDGTVSMWYINNWPQGDYMDFYSQFE